MAGSKKKRKGTPRPNNGGWKPQGKLTKSLDKAIRSYCRKENKSYEDVIKKRSGYCYKDMLPRHLRRKASTNAVSNSMRSIRNKASENNNTTKMNNNKSKYIGQRVNKQDDDWGEEPFNGTVEYDKKTKQLVVKYDDGEYAEYANEENMIADGHKIGEYNISKKKKQQSQTTSKKKKGKRGAAEAAQSTTTARKKRKTAAQQKQPSTSTSTSSTTRTAKRSEVIITPTNNGGASDTTFKRATRGNNRLTRSSAESLDEESDSDHDEPKGRDKQQPPTSPTAAKDKERDENDATELNKRDTTLDTDMEKEEEKDDDSTPLEGGAAHDENMFDEQQSPVRGGGSSMQSPAKSVSSSDGANYNAIVLSTLAPFAKEMQRKADEIGEEITKLYEQRIVAPLEQQITTIKRRIEKRENILENESNKDTDDLEDCYKPNIAECKLDLEGKRKELAEKELELESIRGGGSIQQSVLANCTSAAQAQLSVRDVSGINLLAPSTDSDINATTGSTSNIDTQMVDSITTQLMPEVTNRCKEIINARMPGLIKILDATKSKVVKELESRMYNESVLPLKGKRDRLTYAYNIKVEAYNSIVDGVKNYPGGEEEYWDMVSEERALLDKKTDELKKEVDEARSIYHKAKEIWIDDVKKEDLMLQNTFTIMIGSVKIEPSQENDDNKEDDDTEK